MAAAQYDSWQLSHLVHGYDGLENRPTYTAAEKQYAEAWNSGSCATPILVKSLADFIVPVTAHSKCNSLFLLCCKDFAQKTRKELNRLKRVQPAGSSLYSSACFSFAVRIPRYLGVTLGCSGCCFVSFFPRGFTDSRPEVMNITSPNRPLFGPKR